MRKFIYSLASLMYRILLYQLLASRENLTMNIFPENELRVDNHSQNQMIRLNKAQDMQNFLISQNYKVDFNNLSVIMKEEQAFSVKTQNPAIIFLTLQAADVQRNIEISKRLVHDDVIANIKKQHKDKQMLQGFAQIKAIMEDSPKMMNESITYLKSLAEQDQFSALKKRAVMKNSIAQYFSQIFMFGSTFAFYNNSTSLLNNRLLEIVQEFHKSQRNYPPWMRIQIQIIAHFFRVFHQFSQYLPNSNHLSYLNKKMAKIIGILKIDVQQFKQLRKIYSQRIQLIAYFEQKFNLRSLAQTYAFILLKQKILVPQKHYKIDQIDQIDQIVKKLKIYKQEGMLKSKCNMESQDKCLLSEFYANTNENSDQQKNQKTSQNKIKVTKLAIIYEKMMELQNLGIQKTGQIDQLNKLYAENIDNQAFQKYKAKKRKLQEQYNYDLSKLKDQLITKQLIRNSNCSYEDMQHNIYHLSRIFIQQQYFEGNLDRLLMKEVHYQQLRYLKTVLQGINQHKKKVKVIFVDCFSLTEGKDSTIIAVNLSENRILCKKPLGTMNFFLEVQLILRDLKPSIIILFDEEFLFSDKVDKKKEVELLRMKHDLFFLPRVSMAPNPCKVLWNSIEVELREKLLEEFNWKEASQVVLQGCIDPSQIKVVHRQWEWEPKFTFPDISHSISQKKMDEIVIKTEGDSKCEYFHEALNNEIQQIKEVENVRRGDESSQGLSFTQIPRLQCKRENDLNSSNLISQYPIMENFQARSANDLRYALARLLQLNNKKFFLKWQ